MKLANLAFISMFLWAIAACQTTPAIVPSEPTPEIEQTIKGLPDTLPANHSWPAWDEFCETEGIEDPACVGE